MQLFNRIIVRILPLFPKPLVWLFSKRYIAGKTLSDAVEKTRDLNRLGCCGTMDVLGEDIEALEEAAAEKEECLRALEAIKGEGLDANLSLKLTALGLKIDKDTCYENVRSMVEKARELGNFVRIDMEDSACTDDTLEMYRRLRKDFDNVGTVIQAYLKRSREDVRLLIQDGIAHLRLCKGIYDEPAEIAFKDRDEVRESFMDLVAMMAESGSYQGIATHDKALLERSLDVVTKTKLNKDQYEFQMLLGVTEGIRSELVKAGHRMRVYVPYGEHWYGYSMRRLKENPKVAGHIIKNLFIRG
jgi:proline dehydrogenase